MKYLIYGIVSVVLFFGLVWGSAYLDHKLLLTDSWAGIPYVLTCAILCMFLIYGSYTFFEIWLNKKD